MGNCTAAPDAGKRVVVIGGGYAGQAISSLLDGDYFVTVIDPRDKLVHKIGGVRACVRKEWAESIIVPQDKVLSRGKRTRASAISIDTQRRKVNLDNGLVVTYDYLVIASGGQSRSPAEPHTLDLVSHYADVADKISTASNIVVIGGGPVGVELTGEILGKYPTKKVTIVHAGDHLCDNVKGPATAQFSSSIKEKLEEKGVRVILGDSVDLTNLESSSIIQGERDVQLVKSGDLLQKVDLVLVCAGYSPNTSFLPGTLKDERGLIKVDENLRVVGSTNVFAIGDCNNVAETKTFVVAGTQMGKMEGWPIGHADVVASNIRSLSEKSDKLTTYTPNTQWFGMIVPIGPNDSVVAGYPEAFGAYKAGSYFISNQWEAAKLPTPTLPQL